MRARIAQVAGALAGVRKDDARGRHAQAQHSLHLQEQHNSKSAIILHAYSVNVAVQRLGMAAGCCSAWCILCALQRPQSATTLPHYAFN